MIKTRKKTLWRRIVHYNVIHKVQQTKKDALFCYAIFACTIQNNNFHITNSTLLLSGDQHSRTSRNGGRKTLIYPTERTNVKIATLCAGADTHSGRSLVVVISYAH